MSTGQLFGNALAQDSGERGLTLPDAELEFTEQFLSPQEAADCFGSLMAQGAINWRQDYIKMYGRELAVPRLNAWYGDAGLAYTYSGIPMQPEPWTSLLGTLRRKVERAARAPFTSVLINLYRDGRDSVAWHADDEPELGAEPVIASLSLGATREFQMRHRRARLSGLPVFRLQLSSGSLLIMRGPTQANWQHQVPKRRGRHSPGPRINLTFRRILAAGSHTG